MADVHFRTAEDWLARAQREGEGSLGERKRGRPIGACRMLTLADEAWLRDQIFGPPPQQIKLPFALWTHPAVKALVREWFGIEMDRLIGKYLKRGGFTPQHPVKRALEQRPEQVAQWLNETYPAVVARAKE